MHSRALFRSLWFLSILVILSMACGLVSQAGELKSTAETMATQVESGKQVLGTGQALATEFGESGVKQTLQAVATGIGESGVQETVQAVVTKIGESGAEETLQAFATDIDEGGYKETLEAKVTELPSLSGEKPSDIPVVSEVEDVLASSDLVSYFTGLGFQAVVDFYEREMLINGWSKIEGETEMVEHLATLNYQKSGRKATVLITELPVVGQTTVVITIQGE